MADFYEASSVFEQGDENEVLLSLEEYEDGKKHLQGIIDRGEAARRLSDNPDFIMLIMEGYLQNEAMRLADLMASGKLNETVFNGCVEGMKGIGHFRNYMKMHIEQGRMAAEELESLEEAREQSILAEEAAAS